MDFKFRGNYSLVGLDGLPTNYDKSYQCTNLSILPVNGSTYTGAQTVIGKSVIESVLFKALENNIYNATFTKKSISIRGFQFYAYDLKWCIPTILDKIDPLTAVQVQCNTSKVPNSPLTFTNSSIEANLTFTCQLATSTDKTNIAIFNYSSIFIIKPTI